MRSLEQKKRELQEKDRRIRSLEDQLRRARETTPAASTISIGGSKTHRLSDVPAWHDEEKEDKIKFSTWILRIQKKFEVNADMFPNDGSKLAYIESRVEGKAAAALEPYIDGSHPAQLRTSAELIEHLREIYDDPDKKRTARREFKKLTYEISGDFADFKSQFIRLAGASGKAHDEWKEEFRDRLPTSLQIQLVTSFMNSTVDFKEYVKLATEYVTTTKQAYADR